MFTHLSSLWDIVPRSDDQNQWGLALWLETRHRIQNQERMSSEQINRQPAPETQGRPEPEPETEVEVEPEVAAFEALSIGSLASFASSMESGNGPSTSRNRAAKPGQPLTGCVVRIKRELMDFRKHPPPNCSADMYLDDLFRWTAGVDGPAGSVYEGGHFRLDIRFSTAYPFRPPRIRFITRIYHCNVDSRGVICLDVLGERWSPVMNVAKVLLSIYVLMSECNPEDPLVMCIADQYKTNRKEHDRIARHWTKLFAMPKSQDKVKENEQSQDQNQEPKPMPSQSEN
ncbi:ubiquitin-conjugating enzyme E2 4 [Drosophila elegans]|uniref:ubiquitin-conjugating enzyme E2 4 n=1 Tax=Drosophila elegans TaxID=30023 RepID=UPI0007E6317C|nr:ubiquitin-conjugating enzyme E2 4 [Drosophila elegans]